MLVALEARLRNFRSAVSEVLQTSKGKTLGAILLISWVIFVGVTLNTPVIFYDGALHLNQILGERGGGLFPPYFYLFPRILHRTALILISSRCDYHPECYRWFNLVLHGLNCLLVYRLFLHLTSSLVPAFLVAVAFSVGHHCQVVCLIGAMSELMVTAFVLGALVAWFCFLDRPRWSMLLAVAVFSIGAYWSRDNAIVLPILLAAAALLYDRALLARQPRARYRALGLVLLIPLILVLIFPPTGVLNPPQGRDSLRFAVQSVRILTRVSNNCIVSFFRPYQEIPERQTIFPIFALVYCGLLATAVIGRYHYRGSQPINRSVLLMVWCLVMPAPYMMLQQYSNDFSFPLGYGYPLVPFVGGLVLLTFLQFWECRWLRLVVITVSLALTLENYTALRTWWRQEVALGMVLHDIAGQQPIDSTPLNPVLIVQPHDRFFSQRESAEILSFYCHTRIAPVMVVNNPVSSDGPEAPAKATGAASASLINLHPQTIRAVLGTWNPGQPIYWVSSPGSSRESGGWSVLRIDRQLAMIRDFFYLFYQFQLSCMIATA